MWKKVSEVKVGSKIELAGSNYTVKGNMITDLLLINAVGREIKASEKVQGTGDDWHSYNHKVFVLSEGNQNPPTPKQDLTTQLRSQISKKFPVTDNVPLVESLRCQLAKGVEAKSAVITTGYTTAPAQDARISAQDVKISAVNAKVDANAATLKAQVAQASLRANEAVYGIQTVTCAIEDLVEDTNDTLEDVSEAISNTQEDIHILEDVVNDLQDRLSALEDSEEKRKLQALFNEKIANKTVATAQGGKKSMSNLLGSFKGLFGKVEGQFALSLFGGIAIRKGGLGTNWVTYDAKNGITDVQDNVITKFDVPAFKLPVPAAEIKVGDIVVNNGAYQYVTEVSDGFVKTVNPSSATYSNVMPIRNPLLGKAFYTSVKVIDFTNAGGAAQAGGFNPMLLMALSGDKGGDKSNLLPLLLASGGLGGAQGGAIDPTMLMLLGDNTDDLLPFILLQQGGISGANGLNPLLLMALSGDKNDKGKKDLLPLLLATGGLGGAQAAGGINPMLLMALSGDGDMSDILPLLLMSGGLNPAPATPVTPATNTPKA